MATRLLPPGYQLIDANGNPVAGAQLYTYEAGTSTPKVTFSDAGNTIPNANPIVADAAGRFGNIFADTGDYRIIAETSTGVVIFTADPVAGDTGLSGAPGAGIRNLLLDGDFSSVKTLTTTGVDGASIADNWYVLTELGDVTASLQTLQQDGIPNNLRIRQTNAVAQRFGVAQIISAENSYRARGGNVPLSGKIRRSFANALRYAVLAWTGAADSVTRDVVLDWNSTNYTPGGFFISSNLVVVATGALTPTANIWTDLPSIVGAVSSAMTNLIVFVWAQNATAQNATFDMTQLQLEVGDTSTAYEFLPAWLALVQDVNTTGKALIQAADAATARTAISAPKIPALGTWATQTFGDNAPFVLPAGGTWAFIGSLERISDAVTLGGIQGSVGAGGAVALGAGGAGNRWTGIAWQI